MKARLMRMNFSACILKKTMTAIKWFLQLHAISQLMKGFARFIQLSTGWPAGHNNFVQLPAFKTGQNVTIPRNANPSLFNPLFI